MLARNPCVGPASPVALATHRGRATPSREQRRWPRRWLVSQIVAATLSCAALHAHAQVWKCVEAGGRTAYQQAPCPAGQKGVRMSVGTAPAGGSPEAEPAGATRREINVGMSRAEVAQVRGTPQEMRPGREHEKAAEVWVYRSGETGTAVGFMRGVVAWVDAAYRVPILETRETVSSRRQNLPPGRDCASVVADLGPPQSESAQPAESDGSPVLLLVYEPAPGDAERTLIYCSSGAISRVDRLAPR